MRAFLAIVLALVPACAFAPTKGEGAWDLLKPRPAKKAKVAAVVPPLPSIVIAPSTNRVPYFFAVTAYNGTNESDFSNEVSYTRNSATNTALIFAWDAGTNAVGGYRLYQGRASGTYTNTIDAGTNTQVTYLFPPPLTNLLVTVSTAAGNLAKSTDLHGVWRPLSPPQSSISLTNPAGPIYYRSYGNGAPAVISTRRF